MKWILVLATVVAQLAFAESNDNGREHGRPKEIPVSKLRYQIEIKGYVYVFDKAGTGVLYRSGEYRSWKFGGDKPIDSTWTYQRDGFPLVAIKHIWDVDGDRRLTLKLQQFEAREAADGDVKLGKLIREQSKVIENMESVSWVAAETATQKLVMKFEPILWTDDGAEDIGKLGINSGRLTVFDNKGQLWATRVDVSEGNNVYLGLTTHRGSVFMSYLPFRGSRLLGVARRNTIRLDDETLGDLKLNVESQTWFVPEGVVANVYGIVDLGKKTAKFNSVKSHGTDDEARFLKIIHE